MNQIQLPFDRYEEQLLDLVRNHQVVVLVAKTGAGKSTKAPLALLNAGFGGNKMIGVTESHRMAARKLSRRVTELHGTRLGEVIGYQIGQERETERSCKLKYMTEGILLAELHGDPELRRYSIIVLDEVHERGVNQDLLMALVKGVLPKRPDLKVVIMSATIDTNKFSEYFGGAPVLTVPGQMFPVEVRYARTTPDNYIEAMVEKIDEILLSGEPGDILAFLPDQYSIMSVAKDLDKALGDRARKLRILPLFSQQAPDDQDAVDIRDGRRRVILSTNISETALTIDGVRIIVDSGLIKATVYKDASMSALQVVEHSQAGCDQRKGRAGRTQDGICHRLYTEHDFLSRERFTSPEILRMSLDQVFLRLRCLGYTMREVLALDFMDMPGNDKWQDAHERLVLLGAIDASGNVTKDGERMNRFQTDPMIGRMILEGERRGCLDEILTIAASLSATRPIFIRPKGSELDADKAHQTFRNPTSDLLTSLDAWKAWQESDCDHRWAKENFLSSRALTQVDRLRDQLVKVCLREEIPYSKAQNEDELKKAITAGLLVNLARHGERYEYRWNERETYIFPGSVLMGMDPTLLVCAKVVESTGAKGTKAYMRGCHMVKGSWMKDIIPASACKQTIEVEQDYFSKEYSIQQRLTWNGMELTKEKIEVITPELVSIVAQAIVEKSIESFGLVHKDMVCIRNLWSMGAHGLDSYTAMWDEGVKERREELKKKFVHAVLKRLEGVKTSVEVFSANLALSPVDFLEGDALAQYLKAHEAQEEMREADRIRREEQYRIEEANRQKFAVEKEALSKEFESLTARLVALGYARSYAHVGITLSSDDVVIRSEAQYQLGSYASVDSSYRMTHAMNRYREMVDRLEQKFARENAPKFALTQAIYAAVAEVMPVCPVCGGVWNESYACVKAHASERFFAKSGKNAQYLGSFKTDRDESVAEVWIEAGNSIKVTFHVGRDKAWLGLVFKKVEYLPKVAILPESLVEERELIEMWLKDLDDAKKALEAELAEVEILRKGVASGDIVCLTFRDRGDGFMVAKHEGVDLLAPSDDLTNYPKEKERWWCHIVRTSSFGGKSTNIFLRRKAGSYATRRDIDQIILDGREMFPNLPSSLYS